MGNSNVQIPIQRGNPHVVALAKRLRLVNLPKKQSLVVVNFFSINY